ncbi:CASP-like protein 1E1 [Tripterygium wilfordii]|nr:CASP-like protein 1E1 [Tripterygium wilfordii]
MDVVKDVKNMVKDESPRRGRSRADFAVRVLGFVVTLVGAVLVGIDKETTTVSVRLVETLPPLHVSVTAKWHYMSAFVYLMVSNAIACSYAAASLAYSSINKNKINAFALIILDLIITSMMFSAVGAAIGVGLIGRSGNSHVKWNKVCYVFGSFCHQMTAAIVMSLLGCFAFLGLVLLSLLKLYKTSSA